MKIGRNISRKKDFGEEILAAKRLKFDFVQIWYDSKDGISIICDGKNKIKEILSQKMESIIHAVVDINEYEEHVPILIKILKKLNHDKIIIHPVCKSEKIDEATIYKLIKKINYAYEQFNMNNIITIIENNSKIKPIFYSCEEISLMFENNPGVELLLDLPHCDDLDHLRKIIEIKMPKIIHVSDKRRGVDHEHIALGDGNIDFEYIFTHLLDKFDGMIDIESVKTEDDILKSKKLIDEIVSKK